MPRRQIKENIICIRNILFTTSDHTTLIHNAYKSSNIQTRNNSVANKINILSQTWIYLQTRSSHVAIIALGLNKLCSIITLIILVWSEILLTNKQYRKIIIKCYVRFKSSCITKNIYNHSYIYLSTVKYRNAKNYKSGSLLGLDNFFSLFNRHKIVSSMKFNHNSIVKYYYFLLNFLK